MTTAETDAEVPPGRVARRRIRKVQDILAAAADVLAVRGYRGMSLDEVAERLDLTKATLYHYFPSKEALVSACIENIATRINQRLAEVAADSSGTARERLNRLIITQLMIIVREQPQFARMFLQPMDWPPSYRERTKALRREHNEIFLSVVRDGIANGEFDVDETIAMHNLHGAMNYVPVWFSSKRKKDADEVAAAVAANLLRLFCSSEPAL
jgi:AcrR family transcriptional regulator